MIFLKYLCAVLIFTLPLRAMEISTIAVKNDCSLCFKVAVTSIDQKRLFDKITIYCAADKAPHSFHTTCLFDWQEKTQREDMYFNCPSCQIRVSKPAQLKMSYYNELRQEKDSHTKELKLIKMADALEEKCTKMNAEWSAMLYNYCSENALLKDSKDSLNNKIVNLNNHIQALQIAVEEWQKNTNEAYDALGKKNDELIQIKKSKDDLSLLVTKLLNDLKMKEVQLNTHEEIQKEWDQKIDNIKEFTLGGLFMGSILYYVYKVGTNIYKHKTNH